MNPFRSLLIILLISLVFVTNGCFWQKNNNQSPTNQSTNQPVTSQSESTGPIITEQNEITDLMAKLIAQTKLPAAEVMASPVIWQTSDKSLELFGYRMGASDVPENYLTTVTQFFIANGFLADNINDMGYQKDNIVCKVNNDINLAISIACGWLDQIINNGLPIENTSSNNTHNMPGLSNSDINKSDQNVTIHNQPKQSLETIASLNALAHMAENFVLHLPQYINGGQNLIVLDLVEGDCNNCGLVELTYEKNDLLIDDILETQVYSVKVNIQDSQISSFTINSQPQNILTNQDCLDNQGTIVNINSNIFSCGPDQSYLGLIINQGIPQLCCQATAL